MHCGHYLFIFICINGRTFLLNITRHSLLNAIFLICMIIALNGFGIELKSEIFKQKWLNFWKLYCKCQTHLYLPSIILATTFGKDLPTCLLELNKTSTIYLWCLAWFCIFWYLYNLLSWKSQSCCLQKSMHVIESAKGMLKCFMKYIL